jgi:hypothetical protein
VRTKDGELMDGLLELIRARREKALLSIWRNCLPQLGNQRPDNTLTPFGDFAEQDSVRCLRTANVAVQKHGTR